MVESSPVLTSEVALRIAAESEPEFTWSSEGARVLGPVGENATVLLPEPQLVLRICAGTEKERAAREVSVARWLYENAVPAVRVAEEFPSPLPFRDWVITAWVYVPGIQAGSPSTIGAALRRLHRLEAPGSFGLPDLDPFDGIADHIAQASLERPETEFLRARLSELRDDYARLQFVLPPGPVHGDAHRKNIVRDGTDPVVLDLERFSIGPREWDLVVSSVYQRVGWYTAAEYEAFTSAYGWDLRTWPGYETLAAVRELRMTTWLCSRTSREPRLLTEARRRIASLKQPGEPKRWRPGT